MYFLYSILLSIAFVIMSPLFLLRREKYASGFKQRLGNYPEFEHDSRDVIWLHCVSVGETNAARPLVDAIRANSAEHRLVISTTTRTGQELARKIFANKADAIVYFPFDFKFSVRRALEHFKPSLVLLMETEIWPRFIHEAKRSDAKIAIVNGRISKRSFARYARVKAFVSAVLRNVDVAMMQDESDADRIVELGLDPTRVLVTGNLKFEQTTTTADDDLTQQLADRFDLWEGKPLIVAASTHEPEERYVIQSLEGELGKSCRLMIAPRHPERFDHVANLLDQFPYSHVRRSSAPLDTDGKADVILLDSIGELRAAYPFAQIVFVGGSLISHGGQSILEPAVAARAIVTGPYTANFDAAVKEFLENDAIRQVPAVSEESISECLKEQFVELLRNPQTRSSLGMKALFVVRRPDRDATAKTIGRIRSLLSMRNKRKLRTDTSG